MVAVSCVFVVAEFLKIFFMVYFRHKNEEEKRQERMIEKREKEVMKIYFIM